MAAIGVEPALFDRIIEGAMADHCHKTNPRIATGDEYRELLEASLCGEAVRIATTPRPPIF